MENTEERGGNREVKSGGEGQGQIGARTSSFYMAKAQESVSKVVCVKVAQSCSTLCDPMDYTVHGILQARILEWVAFPFSRRSIQPRDQTQVSHIAGGFFTSWATREAQQYWSGYPNPSPADLPTQESNWSLLRCSRSFTNWAVREALKLMESVMGIETYYLKFSMQSVVEIKW